MRRERRKSGKVREREKRESERERRESNGVSI